ncbi:MAG: hypothetical protein JXQ67_01995 [Campylobacterales bacterium]|nr:hypothetical protein [Campylobacterales bacterium]
MGVLQRVVSLLNSTKKIEVSTSKKIFTKYGPCKAQAYKYDEYEYLVFLSNNLQNFEETIGYIYENKHYEHGEKEGLCGCNNQLDTALKMILKEQGFIIYYSKFSQDIEECLLKIEARPFHSEQRNSDEYFHKKSLKGIKSSYDLIANILHYLNVKKLRLISSDPGIALHVQREGIKLLEWASVISFDCDASGVRY